MDSKYHKLAKTLDHPMQEDDENFEWVKMLDDAIEFYNSWGDVLQWHPNCMLVRYEDLLADPVTKHKEIADFWDLDIPTSCIKAAFEQLTKENMRAKITETNTTDEGRISFRKQSDKLPDHRRDQLMEMVDKKLIYDFGYDLSKF